LSGRGKADFYEETRRLLGDRVGWRCSVPGCHRLTVGPEVSGDEAANIGTAAHIHSAALNGPRGRGGLTDEELAAPSNGISCCADHGREIDTNAGKGYSVETLRGWKRAGEAAARRERTALPLPGAGWVDQVTVVESPRFSAGSALTLGKATVIESEGWIGKTSLFEWIAAAGGEELAERWRHDRLQLTIQHGSPLPHRLEYAFDRGRRYRLDHVNSSEPPADLRIVHLRQDRLRYNEVDDLQLIADALSVGGEVIRGLAGEVVHSGSGFLIAADFEEERPEEGVAPTPKKNGPRMELWVTRKAAKHSQCFRSLSGCETYLLLLEFAAALGRERARAVPTVLLVDGSGWNFSDELWATVAAFLISQPFQVVLTTNTGSFDAVSWQSWDRVSLRREDENNPDSDTVIS
jgi:hypothetical protein